MAEKKAVAETTEEDKIDKELSDLLDSALEDFTEKPADCAEIAKSTKPKDDEAEIEQETEWSNEFIRQTAAQFETNIAGMLGGLENETANTDVQQSFQRMAEAAAQILTNPEVSDSSNDFASTITQTLQELSEGTENAHNPFGNLDLANMLQNSGDGNAFVPFMQGMMQSLLSKEVLYPSLKEIVEKYPAWLEEHKAELTSEQEQNYRKQLQLMEQVCAELQTESETDSSDQKKAHFEKVLALMQKLQDYGQPPADLVGDVGAGLPADFSDPNQCSAM